MNRLLVSLVVLGAFAVFGMGTVSIAHADQGPVGRINLIINGVSTGGDNMIAIPGKSYHIVVDASGSRDSDGWTTSGTGVSQGGKCFVATGLDSSSTNWQSRARVITNPGSPSDCSFDLGTISFSQSHAYPMLSIVDATGKYSPLASLIVNLHQPGAIASISANGGAYSSTISVPKGVQVHLYGDGSSTWDPGITSTYQYGQNNGVNAWDDPVIGMRNGGYCAWNTALSSPASFDKVISNPTNSSVCGNSIDLGVHTFQSSGTYQVLKVSDNTGGFTYASVKVNVVDVTGNKPPIANPLISVNGAPAANQVTVQRGVPATITLSASTSTDPNGWTTPFTGVSQGGKCEWNTDLNSGIPIFEKVITNPATAAACNVSLGKITFNDAPGTYTYNLLRITDALGGISPVGTVTVTVSANSSSGAPVAVAQIKADTSLYGPEQAVTQGVPAHIYLGADTSSDPNGWTTAGTGVSQGGKCEWNKDLNTGTTTFEKVVSNPVSPALCNIDLGMLTFNDAPGRYIYPVLKITDGSGAVSNIASITIVVLAKNSNLGPVAVAKFTVNGSQPASHIYVSRGVPIQIGLDAASSYDPNGWTTAGTGVSQGGKCEWNTNLDQSRPIPFTKIVNSPFSPSACNVNLGTLVFNDPPGTYTYALLRITDANGVQSSIGRVMNNSKSLFARLFPAAYAQSADGSAMVTVVDGSTPTPSVSPNISPTPTSSCNPFGYNPNCPPPTPTPTIPPCVVGQVCDTPSPTPCVPGQVCDTPTPTVVPTTSVEPTVTPDPCPPGEICVLGNAVVGSIVQSASEVVDAVQKGVTNVIAKLLGVDPAQVAKFIAEKEKSITTTFAAVALALSAPFLASNVVPAMAQWGQFLGSFFTIHKRRDRWGIVVDSDLGKPVAQAVVQVFDAQFNQLKETQVTGNDGQFGFLLPVGKYYIIASESGFIFPARKKPPVTLRDGERVYLGEEFEITNEDPEKIPHIIVPMDREEAAPTGNTMVRRYWEQLVEFVDRVGFVFLFIGGAINTYLLLLAPGKLNIFFEVLYLLLFILKLYILLSHQRGIGSVLDRGSRKLLDLSIIRLYDAATNRIVQTKVTNKNGRFFILAPKGEYTASVSKPGYKTLLIKSLHIKSNSSKPLALDFALEPIK